MSSTNNYSAATLDTHAAAKFLSVSQSGLNRWRKHGGGPAYVRLGKRTVRYRPCDLDTFLASRVIQSKEG